MKHVGLGFSLRGTLIFSFLMIGIVPIAVLSFVTYENNSQSLLKESESRLTALREAKAVQIEGLFDTIFRQIKTMSNSSLTLDAYRGFSDGFDSHYDEIPEGMTEEAMKTSIRHYYKKYFYEEYLKKNNGEKPPLLDSLADQLNGSALSLQYNYISHNSNPLGSKHLLDEASDGTAWSKAHGKYHSNFKNFLEEFGYYDIFIVDNETGNIIYSVFKELDFATSLLTGPYSKTNFADVFRDAASAVDPDYVGVVDLAQYFPSYEFPAGFVSSPIFDGTRNVATLVFQIPVEKVDSIMTNQEKWNETGYGDSGETYIVGIDKKMRSQSRFLVENPKGYFNTIKKLKLKKGTMDYIRAKNTTVITQPVDTAGVRSVIETGAGFDIFPDYRGVRVLSSFKPLNIKGLKWFLMSEMDEEEALDALIRLKNLTVLIVSSSLVLILIFSLIISNRLAKKLRHVLHRLKDISKTTTETEADIKLSSDTISSSATQQAAATEEAVSTLNEITSMFSQTVRNIRASEEKSENSYNVASTGNNVVSEMDKAMQAIRESNMTIIGEIDSNNSEIGNIAKVIKDISEKTNVIHDIVFQTKLLSFNASVEAARAGEHGKGFSVVAEEVGNLATMSGNAAKEIAEMLSDSVVHVNSIIEKSKSRIEKITRDGNLKVESGIEISEKCGEALREIVKNASDVRNLLSEITRASEEQERGVKNILEAMSEIKQSTSEFTVTAVNASECSSNLSTQTALLDETVSNLARFVDGRKAGSTHVVVELPSATPSAQKEMLAKTDDEVSEFTDDDFRPANPRDAA